MKMDAETISAQYSGAEVFKMVDTHGIPLDIINQMMREQRSFFSAPDFIAAAQKAGWTGERIYRTMISASPLQGEKLQQLKSLIKKYTDT